VLLGVEGAECGVECRYLKEEKWSDEGSRISKQKVGRETIP
jgi:hypothetical protein